MNRLLEIVLAATLIAVATVSPLAAADVPEKYAEKIFELRIENGKVAKDETRVRVTQGDTVRLRWTSDKALVLHLHGYDIQRRVEPRITIEMTFTARATGKFPVHAHSETAAPKSGHIHEVPLMFIEVYPR